MKSVYSVPPFCESDHVSVLCQLHNHVKFDDNSVAKPNFKKADYAFLATIDWDVVYASCRTMNDYWVAFKNVVDTSIFNFVPFVCTGKSKSGTPWFNADLKKLRARKQRKWRKYVKSSNIVTPNTKLRLNYLDLNLLSQNVAMKKLVY